MVDVKMIAAILCILATLSAPARAFGLTVTYEYDSLNRLSRVTYDSWTTIEYSHDATGNRLSETVLSDSDGDSLPDIWEVTFLGDLARDGSGDHDGDGLSDLEEYRNRTDPGREDTDGDGMPDGWEVQYSLNPLGNDASGDPDRDGYTNLEEYLGNSDPNDPADPTPSSKALPWIPLLLFE